MTLKGENLADIYKIRRDGSMLPQLTHTGCHRKRPRLVQ